MTRERTTDAQAAILRRVLAIPPGYVRTYGDISPGAPRLAGQVLSRTDASDAPGIGSSGRTGRLQRGLARGVCLKPRESRSTASE
jgi:methylated-DNA-protein-cysteine methyltransferase related protein